MMHVFKELLGDRYEDLAPAVRNFHDVGQGHFTGAAFSGGADHLIARSLRSLFGFPKQGSALDVDIWLDRRDGRDSWRRKFGDRRFASSFRVSGDGCLDERFTPFRFAFRLRAEDGRMYWDFERWSFGRLPLPKWLGPRIETYEAQDAEGNFEFYSHADFPIIGRLVHYHGHVSAVE